MSSDEVAREGDTSSPYKGTDSVIDEKFFVIHIDHTGHDGSESAHKRHEARKDDSAVPVLVVKDFGTLEV